MAVHPNRKTTLNGHPVPMSSGPPSKPLPEFTAKMRLNTPDFKDECQEKGITPTLRQARKYNARTHKWANR